MGAEQIHLVRQKVLNTETYKKLSKIQQKISTMRNNIKAIENALKVVENTSFAQWEKTSNSNYLNKLIVKEISNEQ